MKKRTHLIRGYSYQLLDWDEFLPLYKEYRPKVFSGTFMLRARDYAYSQQELEALEPLANNMGSPVYNHFAVYKDDEFVAWSTGTQETASSYSMINSGVLPEHQGKGIYSALLPVIVKRVKSQGFQLITSRHNATNNQVIIPKLKAGFVISGLELSDGFGTLAKLSYFMNETRRQVMDMRSGLAKPTKETLELIGYSVADC